MLGQKSPKSCVDKCLRSSKNLTNLRHPLDICCDCGILYAQDAGNKASALRVKTSYQEKFSPLPLYIPPNTWYNTHMKATQKDPKIDQFILSRLGRARQATIAAGECVTWESPGNTSTAFTNDIPRKEYAISGMCQSCQDDFFGISED